MSEAVLAGERSGLEIAVIGMAGRFPGAGSVEELWRNLCSGVESVHFFSDAELLASGVPASVLARPDYVKARAVLEGAERFDAEFFGFTPREAEILDPQHRLFLESAWEALEDAGYDSLRFPGDIGVFAGAGLNTYAFLLFSQRELLRSVGAYQAFLATDKDFLATRASYKLNLTGPSLTIQTACSTSLVAVHVACQSLLAGECQMALAGGVSVSFPQQVGYLYEEGGIHSPDGHCRAFDAQSQGTVSGNGLGIVVLRRLDDALEAGDRVIAVIKGSAINNDGSSKVGYTAPSIEGQAKVIRVAQAIAGVDPATIGFVEAHGTGTSLGDPIEMAALRRAFASVSRGRHCALGAVKGNVGHLDTASGVTGLIKAVLALERRVIPPTLHFSVPNPQLALEDSPFYVNDHLLAWDSEVVRRAAVSSFGIGGTNAHVVLEEAPPRLPVGPSRSCQLLLLSARSGSALERLSAGLREHLWGHPGLNLPDVAFTLQTGRRQFEHRRAVLCGELSGAVKALAGEDPESVLSGYQAAGARPVAFLFPGQGSQYVNMGLELYREEEGFREQVDLCCDLLSAAGGPDLRRVLYPPAGREEEAARELAQTAMAQPALFTIEYALARLWMSWGVEPEIMLGHSLGEYVAACLAEVLTLAEALSLVSARGRLMQGAPAGAMLAVPLPEAQLQGFLGSTLSVAAVNGPDLSTISGPPEAVLRLASELEGRGLEVQRLHTSHAFHSAAMDAILEPFALEVRRIHLQPPQRAYLSNLTGVLVRAEEATDPEYWVRHLRQTVRFGDNLREVLQAPGRVLLEVGPGRTLGVLARREPGCPAAAVVLSSLPHARERLSSSTFLLSSLGRLWLSGVEIDWSGFYAGERRQRVSLPSYPFERKEHWLPGSLPLDEAADFGLAGTAVVAPGEVAPFSSTGSRPALAVAYVEPRVGDERRVAGVWEELLGIHPIGRHDNFFELGGHSLAATRLAARLRSELAVDLPLRELLAKPTVAAMADLAARGRGLRPSAGLDEGLPALIADAANRYEPFHLTDVQQAYWLGRSDAFELGNVATHNYLEIESEDLDLERFTRSLRLAIERHEMLRSIVLPEGRQQILREVAPYEIAVSDLRGTPAGVAAGELARLRERMSHQVLPSSRWPLFEVRAALLGEGRVRLYVSFDFLIGDAWSWHLLLSELAQLYIDPGRSLPVLELSFRDYVLLDAELVHSALYERSRAYWQSRIASLPAGPQLPLAQEGRTPLRPSFVRRSSRLESASWQRLKRHATRMGLTSSGVVAAAFSELLSVWSKTAHFTLNLTLFNRLPVHPQVNAVLGDFTSLTLLEVDNRERAPFKVHAHRLQSRLWEDLDHRYFGGVRVLRELGRSRGTTGQVAMPVVFTSLLTMTETDSGVPPDGLPRSQVVYSLSQTPQVWLDHQVAEREGALVFNWDAVEELFPAGVLDDMFDSYERLLVRLSEDEAFWELPLVAAGCLPAWQLGEQESANATQWTFPDLTLHELFRAQAALRPEQLAVVAEERSLTYAELLDLSSRWALLLQERGAAPNRLVAVVMEKGWEQAVAVLAVLQAGAAYLPIDPGLPAERLHHLLEQGAVGLVLTQPRLARDLAWPAAIECLAVGPAAPPVAAAKAWTPAAQPGDLAYVIFTSGSTGLPKGVMVDHRAAVNTVLDVNRRWGVGPGDRVLALSSLSFDLSVYDLFGLFAAGGTVVFPAADSGRDPGRWLEVMERTGITVWNSVPALLEMLLEYAGDRPLPGSLRLVLLSGDWIALGLPDRLRTVCAGASLVNLGGATEASIWSIFHPIGRVDPGWSSIPYGKPLANQSFHVLDATLAPRPFWVAGELYIGGRGVARGYWRDGERTAERFLAHPVTGERLYRTGDFGRYLPDGSIEFLGREDLQVKIQGHRIELGEVEAALVRHPGVQSAVVAALGEPRLGRHLVAYVVLANRGTAPGDLERHLRARLPSYMVPARFVVLDALPLTDNGKLDRRALATAGTWRETERTLRIAATPTEEILAGIWSELLSTHELGLEDDFFAHGGDSLQAIRVISRIREIFAVELPLRELFAEPTVAGLAARVERAREAGQGRTQPPIVPVGRERPLPLSYAQQRLWFLDQLRPGDPAYNIAAAFYLTGQVSLPGLKLCLEEIIRRHESLRTTFRELDGEPRQVILPPQPCPLPVADLSFLAESMREPEARRLLKVEGTLPFDLARGPLLRCGLLRLEAENHLALVTLHHAISDAWSLGVLMHELAELYRAFVAGHSSPFAELPIQYADYAVWQRGWFRGEVMESALAYWRERLGGEPSTLHLPTDRPRSAAMSSRGAACRFRLGRPLTDELQALSRGSGATLFMTLLAGFGTLLQRYTQQGEIVIGTPVANRGRREIEGLIGCFINLLALRADLTGDPPFSELLLRVREATLEGFAHQEFPFDRLVEELQPQRDLTRNPLFQVMLVLQNAPSSATELPGLRLTSARPEMAATQFDLTLTLVEAEGELAASFEYATDLFVPSSVQRMATHLGNLLRGAVAGPRRRLATLPLLSIEEAHQLQREWQAKAEAAPVALCVHQLFERQAQATPDASAVACAERILSYAELNGRANRIARRLVELGVQPGSRVGLYLSRSERLLVAMLGILKAGGAYVPLDPEYPAGRLTWIAEEARIEVVVTEASVVDVWQPGVPCFNLDTEPAAARDEDQNPSGRTALEIPAYVIYTSGSTGRPKGVEIRHEGLATYVETAARLFRIVPGDRVLQFASINFDTSAEEIYPGLARGAILVLRTATMLGSDSGFLETCERWGITVLDLPTAYWHQLGRSLAAGDLTVPSSLRLVIVGGEAAQAEGLSAWRTRATRPVRLVNTYGPTEATIVSTLWESAEASGPLREALPIGRSVEGSEAYALDLNGRVLPIGMPGELSVGGRNLAVGYLDSPDVTADRFAPDPFSGRHGARLYRTGDLVRRGSDGNLEFLGRVDRQVKIRGFRIELGEVEARLSHHLAVQQAVVMARVYVHGDLRLFAYVVARPGEAPAADTLRAWLKEALPVYMLPSIFVFLEGLPLTPSRKVDRGALPAPGLEQPQVPTGKGALGPTEEILAGIWCDLLGLTDIGPGEDFFALGGHSLLATQVLSRLRSTFGAEVSLRALFDRPTVAGLASEVESALRGRRIAEAPPLVRLPRGGDLPLSFAQQRLWFIDQLEPGSPAYNIPTPLRALGPVDFVSLSKSLTEVVRRHESLRTTFLAGEGGPVQRIGMPWTFELPLVDLAGLGRRERTAEVKRLVIEEARRPFDLARGPLLRAVLLKEREREHAVLFSMHHIVSDHWSTELLVREVTALYEAFRQDLPSPLPELAIQYADFATWQYGWLSGEVLERELSYWREQLAGAPQVLELPTDRPRPAVQRYQGSRVMLALPGDLSEQLRAFSRSERVTLFMTLLAAFQTLLSRYSGQCDISVGTPIAGRNRLETEGLIGFFVNTLVLRGDLSGNPRFGDLLGRVRRVVLAALTHQDLPFEMLVEDLQPARTLSHDPLFQVMVDFHDLPRGSIALSGLSWQSLDVEPDTVHFDLILTGLEAEESLGVALAYRTDLFDGATVRRMSGHLRMLLEGIVGEPERGLSELPLLTPQELHQLLSEWREVERFEAGPCLHHRFEEQARRSPGAPAVVMGVESLTYGQLDHLADRFARRLQSLGIGPEAVVGILLERSLALVVGILGVLKAGGAYLPLDPAYPQERLDFLLSDSGTRWVVTERRLEHSLPSGSARRVYLEEEDREEAGQTRRIESGVRRENLAYVIYTSGSTGRPRGVLVSHANAGRLLSATEGWFGFGPRDVWTLFHSFAFDFAVWEMWGALAYGGSLVVVPYWVSRSPDSFYELLIEEQVTVLNQTPSAFRQLMRAEEDLGGAPLESLRLVIFGGEALEYQSLRPWAARRGVAHPLLVNMYGITETTVHVTYRPLVESDIWSEGGSAIGRAIPDLDVRVLDSGFELQPLGVPGELCVSGAGLARGYLRRPELTAQRFVPDPWGTEPGVRLYRSGDLVRRLMDGDIEYLGRIDHQVKVRGFRIEPGEIEAALVGELGAREAVVVVREDDPGDRQLVAYVVGGAAGVPKARELRRALKRKLPEPLVPSVIVELESLPLTVNGKVDRQRLPAPPKESAGHSSVPRTPLEGVLAAIWSEVLRLERVGTEENFFDLGGHSLLATQVTSRARQAFGVEMPLRDLFEAPTIAGLAMRVERALQGGGEVDLAPIRRVPRSGGLPLSFAQQRLWFLDRFEPGNPAYNLSVPLLFRGRLDPGALRRSLEELTRRHEVLRTVFDLADEPVQQIVAASPFPLPVVDLCGLGSEARQAVAVGLGEKAAAWRFDLTRGPLLRAVVLRLGVEEHGLLFVLHHIVSDAWSLEILIREMAELYGGLSAGRPVSLPELSIQYADYACWQRERLRGELLEREVGYWREKLGGAPPALALPTDRPLPRLLTFGGRSYGWRSAGALKDELSKLGRRQGATAFMTLLAAFQALLARYSGQGAISVGTPISGRNRLELESLIGFFLNTLVIRTSVSDDPSFLALLGRVREGSLGGFLHQELPFDKLVEELQPERDLGRTPLFQVSFVFERAAAPAVELAGLSVVPLSLAGRTAKFSLTLAVVEDGEVLRFVLEYNTDLFDRATIQRLGRHFETLFGGVAVGAERRLSELPLLSSGERAQLLLEWNDTWVEGPGELCLPDWVARQSARSPDAVAVVCEGGSWSYGELRRASLGLARHLSVLGVGPESVVGICAERSWELMVGLLGILTAGGAYLPLDAGYPEERLQFMLADSGASVLVAQESLAERLASPGLRTVHLDAGGWQNEGSPVLPPSARAYPDGAAYVIYTSGSTGRPKGVVVAHRGICNRLLWMQEAYGLTPEDRVLQKTPIGFDVSVWELFWPLLSGACLVLARPDGHRDASYLVRRIGEERITTLHFVPSLLGVFLAEDDLAGCNSLLRVVCSGEALPVEAVERFFSRLGGGLFNLYGPTEASVDVTAWRCAPGLERRRVPIGRPISGMRTVVLDVGLGLSPCGVAGQLYLGGVGLARGYLGRPELTAERFVPDAWSGCGGERLYQTGDLVRWRSDGSLDFLGRIDHQVKIRGIRIELGEIELALEACPGVREAAVVVRRGEGGEVSLNAFVSGELAAVSGSLLRDSLRRQLPEAMVPAGVAVLAELPHTPAGKVDRQTLATLEPARVGGTGAVAPRNVLELQLAQLWEEVLGVEPVGVHDDFFALGGHSLLAVRLASLIRRCFGRDLPLSVLFQDATVERMAGLLREGQGRVVSSAVVALQPQGDARPFFCVHPAGGGVLCLLDLAHALGEERPFYGLMARGWEGEEEPLRSIEEMASSYLQAIRQVQPAGPYLLGGWSLGGLVAFEMSQQLAAVGESVALLALLDTSAEEGDVLPDDAEILYGFLIGLGLPISAAELRSQGETERQLAYAVARAQAQGKLSADTDMAKVERYFQVCKANLEAASRYRLRPYCGPVTLFRTRPAAGQVDPTPLWERYAGGGLMIHEIPGLHWDMVLQPHVQVLAERLRGCLELAADLTQSQNDRLVPVA